ncbi:hypothetical protein IFM89_017362 [Coptis chinensis]|uniref:non-specific serine/threonine protein kinase n=1 Tax=Coptis chinensis TaxID=261450 RepID=A0A835LHL8_9MAGN|nr:hypothetical protein IFM89_017362 [Coptis chinensis]
MDTNHELTNVFDDLSDVPSVPQNSTSNLKGTSNGEKKTSSAALDNHVPVSCSLKSFSFNDLKTATKNFRSESFLGEGGFGCVFKGWIDENTFAPTKPGVGIVVAIKKLKIESYQGHKEWLAEVNYLGQLRHDNLVKLIGYCCESDNRLLVYEFMPRGSLENHLFRSVQPISWTTRMKIVIDVARGISFLHNLDTHVIYRDLKASNVLLDSEFNAKLSDFGLARDGPTGDNTHVSTRVVGTEGYAAPEYVATGDTSIFIFSHFVFFVFVLYHLNNARKLPSKEQHHYHPCKRQGFVLDSILKSSFCNSNSNTGHWHLTTKSDVYSFGVVLLELLSGKRALDEDRPGFLDSLVDWAKPFLSDNRRVLRIMDTRLGGQYSKKEAQTLAALVLQCLYTDPKNRPHMKDVLTTLEQLQTPNNNVRRTHHRMDHRVVKHTSYHHKAKAHI